MTNSEKSKKYYWFKMTETLLNSEKITFLLSHKNGLGFKAWYFYQKLIIMSANSKGALINVINGQSLPLSLQQLVIAMPGFTLSEVKSCLKMLANINLIAKKGRLYYVLNIEMLVGNSTKGAIEKANQRTIAKAKENAMTAVSLLESDELIEQQANSLVAYVYEINFIRSMTNQDTAETLLKEFKTLIAYYGMAKVEKALKFVIEACTNRDDNGIVVYHRIKTFGYKSEVNYLIKAIYGQCEKRAT